MKLTEIKNNQKVFIDANIFIYHFTGASQECRDFLKKCSQRTVTAFTATTVLAEVCHRLMAIEALQLGLTKSPQPASYLQKNPAAVKKLSQYYAQMTNIFTWGIEIVSVPTDMIIKSQIYRQRFGLLTNDSFIPVYMELADTTHLASADQIFSSIPHLHLCSPSDIHL